MERDGKKVVFDKQLYDGLENDKKMNLRPALPLGIIFFNFKNLYGDLNVFLIPT